MILEFCCYLDDEKWLVPVAFERPLSLHKDSEPETSSPYSVTIVLAETIFAWSEISFNSPCNSDPCKKPFNNLLITTELAGHQRQIGRQFSNEGEKDLFLQNQGAFELAGVNIVIDAPLFLSLEELTMFHKKLIQKN